MKKRHVNLIISINGLKAKLMKKNVDSEDEENLIMEYPIYRYDNENEKFQFDRFFSFWFLEFFMFHTIVSI